MSTSSDTLQHIKEVRRTAELIHDDVSVAKAYARLAEQVSRSYEGRVPLIVCVLIGGIIPTAELLRRMDIECELSYVHATRYKHETKGSELEWIAPVFGSVFQRDVLIVDDILDEGVTLAALEDQLLKDGARSVAKAVLTRKIRQNPSATHADFIGLEVPDRYVFGSGMDYKGHLRELRGIWALPQ